MTMTHILIEATSTMIINPAWQASAKVASHDENSTCIQTKIPSARTSLASRYYQQSTFTQNVRRPVRSVSQKTKSSLTAIF